MRFFEADTLLRRDAQVIAERAIKESLPGDAVKRALADFDPGKGRLIPVAIGKAAYTMAKAAREELVKKGIVPEKGIVITKYGHIGEPIPGFELYEAGHPVPDANGVKAAERALELTADLKEEDTVLFLVSGGGSALFEKPLVPLEELMDVTSQLLKKGANITEINTIRKRLSAVKGGRFALHCAPAFVYAVILSDVVCDPVDIIASGPSVPDRTTCEQAEVIVKQYGLALSERAARLLQEDTPKEVPNADFTIAGNVQQLICSAERACRECGYETHILSDCMGGEAREEGKRLGCMAVTGGDPAVPTAYLCGGETVVHVRGTGLGGRNQELALAAAIEMAGAKNVLLFSLGSDGTDGPTEAAGGIADGGTVERMRKKRIDPGEALENNDAYHALQAAGDLIMTGPTGTNVNDLTVLLVRPEK